MAKGKRKQVHSPRTYQDMKKVTQQEARQSRTDVEKADLPGKKGGILITILTVLVMLATLFGCISSGMGFLAAMLWSVLAGFLITLLSTVTVRQYKRKMRERR